MPGVLEGGLGTGTVVLRVGIGVGNVPVMRVVIVRGGGFEVEVGRGSCVTRVVTMIAGALLDDDWRLGSSVSLVAITLRDGVVETPAAELAADPVARGTVVTAVEMAPAALLGVDGVFSKL